MILPLGSINRLFCTNKHSIHHYLPQMVFLMLYVVFNKPLQGNRFGFVGFAGSG